MPKILLEILIVVILSLFNGFFAMSEMALVSVRKTLIDTLARKGNSRAKVIRELHRDPERLFATVQIGISVITILASAFAGASIAEELSKFVANSNLSLIADNAYPISFAVVVIIVTYLNIVLGELVPKSLGLRYSETISFFAAYPISVLSKAGFWLIKLLTFSSNIILKFFKDSTNFLESRISEEEIRSLLREGRQVGTIEPREHEILENVFEFTDTRVAKIMTPRRSIVAFDINQPSKLSIPKIVEQDFTRVPFYDGELNNILGILHLKDLLPFFGKDFTDIDIRKILLPTIFVSGNRKINELLGHFQKRKLHMAIVKNEKGEVEGLITLEDVLEELVGEIADEGDELPSSTL